MMDETVGSVFALDRSQPLRDSQRLLTRATIGSVLWDAICEN